MNRLNEPLSDAVLACLDSDLYRLDTARPVAAICSRMGVKPSSAFIDLYSQFQGMFDSDHCGFLLLDLDTDRESIVTQTMTMREVHSLPKRFLALSDYQVNSLIVYETLFDLVY